MALEFLLDFLTGQYALVWVTRAAATVAPPPATVVGANAALSLLGP